MNNNYYTYRIEIGKDKDGKRIRKTFYSLKSKADARKKAEKYKQDLEIQKATGSVTYNAESFEAWALKWLDIYKKPNVSDNTFRLTYENTVKTHLIPYFKDIDLMNIKPADIQNFYATKKHLSMSMLEKIQLCLLGIFETAIDNELIYKNPVKHVKYKSERQKHDKNVFTDDQIDQAKDYFKRIMPEVVVLLCTGLRRGEMLGLKWEDINIVDEILKVKRNIADCNGGGTEEHPPKWNSYRDIPLTDECISIFNSLEHKGVYVFGKDTSNFNSPQSPNTWSDKLKRNMVKFCKITGAPELTAHELRHTFGTYLHRNKVDIYTIQKVMGHKDIKMTTEIYVHNESEIIKNNILSKINKAP